MMQTDVKAKYISVTGASGVGSTRVRGVIISCTAGAGSVSFKDGGSSGTELLFIPTPASAAASVFLTFPGEGIKFALDPYVTVSTGVLLTFFYG